MNRYQAIGRWVHDLVRQDTTGVRYPTHEDAQAIARQWNRDDLHAAARRRGVKP